MAKVNTGPTAREIDVVVNTLDVDDSTGAVSFKTREGRGSGAPVIIPRDQFDAFLGQMQLAKDKLDAFDEDTTVDSDE